MKAESKIERDQFSTAMARLFLSKGRDPSTSMIKVWFEDLMEFEINDVCQAMEKMRKSSGWPESSKVKELIENKYAIDRPIDKWLCYPCGMKNNDRKCERCGNDDPAKFSRVGTLTRY